MPVFFEDVKIQQFDVDNTLPYDYLQGNVLQKFKLNTKIRIATFINLAEDEGFIFNPNATQQTGITGWVRDDSGQGRFSVFAVGDEFVFTGITEDADINGDYFIIEKLDNSNIRIAPKSVTGGILPTSPQFLVETGTMTLEQVPKGFTFDFGLIENNEFTNFDSKTDGNLMRYEIDDSGGVINDTTYTLFTPVGKRSWQIGLDEYVRIKEQSGIELPPHTYFYEIEQVMYIHPLFTHDQLPDLELNIPPIYFLQAAALKHVMRIRAYRDLQDPNVFQEGIFDKKEGNTGWFDEWINGGQPKYLKGAVTYDNLKGFERDKELECTAEILDTGVAAKFITLWFYLLPEVPLKYQDINTTIRQNYPFDVCRIVTGLTDSTTADVNSGGNTLTNVTSLLMFDAQMLLMSKIQVVGAGIPANTFVTNFNVGGNTITMSQNATATAAGVAISFRRHGVNYGTALQCLKDVVPTTASGKVTLEFTGAFGSTTKAIIDQLSNKNYVIAAVTAGASQVALTANYTTVLLDFNAITLDIPDGVIDADTQYLRHIDIDRHANTYDEVREEEEIVVDSIIELDRSELDLQIENITMQVIATNTTTGEVVPLEQYAIDLSQQPIIGDVRFINLTDTTPYSANSAELLSRVKCFRVPTLDTATSFFYRVQWPFLYRWEKWEQLLLNTLPAAFLDTNEPHNGYNNEWLRLARLTDWSTKVRISTTVSVGGFFKTINIDKDINEKAYLENPDWINETIKVFDGTTELIAGTQPYFKTQKSNRIELSFEYDGSVDLDTVTAYMVARMIIKEQGGITSTPTWSSIYDRGNGLITIVRTGNVFKGSINVDSSLLPFGVLEVTVSASIGLREDVAAELEIVNENVFFANGVLE